MKKPDATKPRNEADAFVELARKLVAVPKREVEAEKVRYEKRKEHEKGKRTT